MATTTRRPGRVQQIAYDDTPLNSSNPDIDARIGWLLAMSRLHHRNSEFQDGRTFVTALADVGFPASRSLLSRWESGEIPISYEGMSAYEAGPWAGDRPDLLAHRLHPREPDRGADPGRAPEARPHDPRVRRAVRRADRPAEDGEALARDWQELGWHLSVAPMVHLRARTWEALAHRLITELPRSMKVAYRQYSTAAMNMASVMRAQDFMVDAIKTYVSDPDVQVITNPMGMLDRLPTRDAARFLLDMIADPPNQAVFSVAIWCSTTKVANGDFTADERSELDMLVLATVAAEPGQGERGPRPADRQPPRGDEVDAGARSDEGRATQARVRRRARRGDGRPQGPRRLPTTWPRAPVPAGAAGAGLRRGPDARPADPRGAVPS